MSPLSCKAVVLNPGRSHMIRSIISKSLLGGYGALRDDDVVVGEEKRISELTDGVHKNLTCIIMSSEQEQVKV